MIEKTKFVAMGAAYVDLVATEVPFNFASLESDVEVVADHYNEVPGGSALNFARLCAKLEIPTVFIGKVGADHFGPVCEALIREAGIEPVLITDPNVKTTFGINMVSSKGESLLSVLGNAHKSLRAEEVVEKALPLLPEARYLYLGSLLKLKKLLPAFEELTQAAQDSGTKIIVDHGRLQSSVTPDDIAHIKNLVAHADYYFPSTDEFKGIWEVDSIEDGLRRVKEASLAVTVVKDSANGAFTLENDTLVHVPSFKITPVNIIGAGDSFNAGVIAGREKGMGLQESIRFGCATAALKISEDRLPTFAEIEAFLSERQKS
jgi:ribokinase